jgi:cytochrome c oxidase subunit 2
VTNSWPALSSAQSTQLSGDWQTFTYAALGVAVLVWALIVYAAVRFRKRPGNETPRSQKSNNPPLEIAWTVAPLLLVIGLFAFTYHIESDVERLAPDPAVRVSVEGFRWGWTFAYAGGPTINGTARNPPRMELPLGATVAISVTSRDVIHSFWVPDMLFKRDAIPGQTSTFDITPTKLGTFAGHCAEFCGLDHALMSFQVRVETPQAYQRWLKETPR